MDQGLSAKFLGENQILIADSASGARVTLATHLITMGASRSRMSLTSSFEEAQAVIQEMKPKIIFCDYMLGKKAGLDLLLEQKKIYESSKIKDTLFVLVTGNASQSAVARAAEEDVDTFIVKPYTISKFKKSLNEAIVAKLKPDRYHQKINEGKELLVSGAVDQAAQIFQEALSLDPAPTLACFYVAQAALMKEALTNAKSSYQKGLSYSGIHYKCLVGLYDLLVDQKKFTEAYELVQRIARYFPANPQRLAAVLKLAVTTGNYADVPHYYELFTALDDRPEDLTRHMCSALAVAGKHALGKNQVERAVEIFDKLAVSCAGKTSYLKYIIESFVDCSRHEDAFRYLKRFDATTHLSEDYQISAVLVASGLRPAGEVLDQGRQLLKQGVETQRLYQILIKIAQEENLAQLAEEFSDRLGKLEMVSR